MAMYMLIEGTKRGMSKVYPDLSTSNLDSGGVWEESTVGAMEVLKSEYHIWKCKNNMFEEFLTFILLL